MTIPKFRAWNKKLKSMYSTDDIVFINFEEEEICVQTIYFEQGLPNERDLDFYTFDEIEFMQSTGIVDKNDKEIFEGDVLKTYDGELAKVVWNEYLGCWEAKFLSENVDLSEVADVKSNRSDCEILGNMHQLGYEVEKEKLYTVEIPNPHGLGHTVLVKDMYGNTFITYTTDSNWREGKVNHLTESEIKKDFPWAWQFKEEVKE